MDAEGSAMHGAIAEKPGMAIPNQTTSLATGTGDCSVKFIVHIPVLWIPAFPAGMTTLGQACV
jgi:hypothetical protein